MTFHKWQIFLCVLIFGCFPGSVFANGDSNNHADLLRLSRQASNMRIDTMQGKNPGSETSKKGVRVIVRLRNNPLKDISPGKIRGNRATIFRKLKKYTGIYRDELNGYLQKKRSGFYSRPRTSDPKREGKKMSPLLKIRSLWIANSIALTVTPEEMKALKEHPEVAEVVRNGILRVPSMVTMGSSDTPGGGEDLWNHLAIGLNEARALGLDGTGIRIGHLDTGINPDHPDFEGKLIAWAEFDDQGEPVESLPHDSHYLGHGTHVASIIVGEITGVAPGAELLSALILPNGYGTVEQALAGMQWVIDPDNDPATDDGAQIVNMSWGMPGTSPVLKEAVDNMIASGVLPVCAIGNDGLDFTYSPGNTPEAVGVGAVNEYDHMLTFSSGGEVCWEQICITKPDISAPGSSIWGLDPSGNYQTLSGTSVAAPHVSGASALLWQYQPDLSIPQLKIFLLNSSADFGSLGLDERYGWGRLDVAAGVDFIDRYKVRYGSADLVLGQLIKVNDIYSVHMYYTYFTDDQGQFLGDESKSFHILTESEQSAVETLGLGDVDGNGFADLVITEIKPMDPDGFQIDYHVYLSLQGAAFSRREDSWYSFSSTSPNPPELIGIADVNNDQKSDLILASRNEAGIGEHIHIFTLLSNGTVFYRNSSEDWATIYVTEYYQVNMGLGDINGDGKADLVMGKGYRDYYDRYPVNYYAGLSTGESFSTLSGWLTIYPDSRKGSLHFFDISDLNGDEFADLIVSGQGGYRDPNSIAVYVYPSNGSSRFNYSSRWAEIDVTNDSTRLEALGDVNGDGVDDLIVGHRNPEADEAVFSIWLADKDSREFVPWGEATSVPVSDIFMSEDLQIIGVSDVGLGSWEN